MRRWWLACLACLVIPVAMLAPAMAQEQLAIRAGKIFTGTGETIEDGVILIRDGKITDVGTDISIPVEARVIDASDKVVMPGIVDIHNWQALSQSNENNPNVPFISVLDGIDPGRDYFEESRRTGVTTVCVMPANNTMFGGQGAVIKTAGVFINDMVVERTAGMKVSMQPTGSNSRMTHYANIRNELRRAKEGRVEETDDDSDDPDQATDDAQDQPPAQPGAPTQAPIDDRVRVEALQKLIKGEIPAFIYCDNAVDVSQALQMIEEYDLKAVLILGRNVDRAVAQIADSELPVVLDPESVFWRTDPRTGDDQLISLPQMFVEKGVPLMFQIRAGGPSLATGYHWYQAAVAVKYGMDREEAIRSITLRPAEVLGVDSLVGSIEPGKDADLVILTGDPLDISTWVETTLVDGRIVYQRSEDDRLRRLLQPSVDERDATN